LTKDKRKNKPTRLQSWLSAFRLRTLPLAVSSTLCGSFMAIADRSFDVWVIALAIVTTLLLQILSNMANDLGDAIKGTDNPDRLGPQRTVQGGEISKKEMKNAIIFISILTLLSGISLILRGLGTGSWLVLAFLLLGLASIAAAIKYTLGSKAYGYHGWGDVFVFLFFGLTGVLGTYFLNAHHLPYDTILMAVSVGLLSTAVLNLNNMRDYSNDKNSGKNTLVVKMGLSSAKAYHFILIALGLNCGVIYTLLNYQSPIQFLFLLVLPFLILDLIKIIRNSEPQKLDPFLKKMALSTFAYVLLFGLGLMLK
jgi:1,4-dihydroxy-2-naphthoate polyprenyltransferase